MSLSVEAFDVAARSCRLPQALRGVLRKGAKAVGGRGVDGNVARARSTP
jgi:hypothetical protein